MKYALINENNVVENIITLLESNAHEFPNAVKVGDYVMDIGDTYVDGFFYDKDGNVRLTFEQSCVEIGKKSMLYMLADAYEEGANSI